MKSMSFSKNVKEELVKRSGNARHCRIAELAGMMSILGRIIQTDNGSKLEIRTENQFATEQISTLFGKLFDFLPEKDMIKTGRQKTYLIQVSSESEYRAVLKTLKLEPMTDGHLSVPEAVVTERSCCKRAFIRGQFLAAGSVTNPEKAYHFEIVFQEEEHAVYLQEMIQTFDIDAKIISRKKVYVVYVKEGSQISDLLKVMEAHIALMQLENVRILKDMRNMVNRQVNCEAANITKTVNAASHQIEDILYIRDTVGFGSLKDELAEMAELRLEFPEASLKELGTMLSTPIGKSGVNHRLAKLCEIASGLRDR